ncbi:MAG: ATP cone domain-containing protein [Minisyncoccia bacterium]
MNQNNTEREIIIQKANGDKEPFDMNKLRSSLFRAGATEDTIEKVVSHVRTELKDNMTTGDIYKYAFNILHRIESHVAKRYSIRRLVMSLGPSGFPFEKFVARLLEAKGYSTLTDQTILGSCVAHEVDVVAWNKEKLIMCEAKYHNELGTKSDLKVALYVKARFDDIKEAGTVFDYGGKKRVLDEGWLITNTKFSSTAIHYGECKNLIMIGWNYPEVGNLQDMIEETGILDTLEVPHNI